MLSTPRGQVGFFYNFWHDKDPQWTRIFSTVEDCPEIPKEFVELHRKGARIFQNLRRLTTIRAERGAEA